MEQVSTQPEAVVAEIELRYIPLIKPSKRPKVTGCDDTYTLLLSTWDITKIDFVEQFKVMLLNRANRVLGICTLTSGSATGTLADIRQLFAVALKANAIMVIVAHNHPSGTLEPSTADTELTRKLKQAGELLDIKVIDHLIITSEGFYSFAQEGTL